MEDLAEDVIQFWIARQSIYPQLSLLALDILAAPASQAYVEKIFFIMWPFEQKKEENT